MPGPAHLRSEAAPPAHPAEADAASPGKGRAADPTADDRTGPKTTEPADPNVLADTTPEGVHESTHLTLELEAPAEAFDVPASFEPASSPYIPVLPAPGLITMFDYDALSTDLNTVGMDRVWHREQEPTVNGVLLTDRIRVVTNAAGSGGYRPGGHVLRVESRAGELTDTGGYLASRSETLGRQASPTSTPNSEWPDPEGSTRWYGFPLYLNPDWPLATDNNWLLITQWKGQGTGSPAIDLGIHKDQLRIGGTGGTSDIGLVRKGVWTYVQIGIRFSADASTGWVEAWVDEEQVLAQKARRTMNVKADGTTDPSYLKQGIYRSKSWTGTHILQLGNLKIGTNRDAVAP